MLRGTPAKNTIAGIRRPVQAAAVPSQKASFGRAPPSCWQLDPVEGRTERLRSNCQLPQASFMGNGKCWNCGRAADPYCGSCATDTMAKTLNSFFGRPRQKSPGPSNSYFRSRHTASPIPVIPQLLKSFKTPDNCLPALPLTCTIILFIAHCKCHAGRAVSERISGVLEG